MPDHHTFADGQVPYAHAAGFGAAALLGSGAKYRRRSRAPPPQNDTSPFARRCLPRGSPSTAQFGRRSDPRRRMLLAIIGMASETNNLVNAMQVPVDREFLVDQ